ncbi:unnamed protein product [Symbiodinium natans]|uniref:Uncharacterized protein n=1 Tax=Symbiodinium natans TaxID=878477 RepID=A0A812GZQ8_9DINO|nr:unnamed protein product [Symbiodinium natans]
MVKTPTGECDGFGLEYKGVWEVDGEDTRLKVKPYQTKEDRKKAAQQTAESGGGGFFQIPKIEPLIGKKEQTDEDLLLNGQDVNEYIRKKTNGINGWQDYMASVMTLEDEESKIADSLEARLNAKLGERDISKVSSKVAPKRASR